MGAKQSPCCMLDPDARYFNISKKIYEVDGSRVYVECCFCVNLLLRNSVSLFPYNIIRVYITNGTYGMLLCWFIGMYPGY